VPTLAKKGVIVIEDIPIDPLTPMPTDPTVMREVFARDPAGEKGKKKQQDRQTPHPAAPETPQQPLVELPTPARIVDQPQEPPHTETPTDVAPVVLQPEDNPGAQLPDMVDIEPEDETDKLPQPPTNPLDILFAKEVQEPPLLHLEDFVDLEVLPFFNKGDRQLTHTVTVGNVPHTVHTNTVLGFMQARLLVCPRFNK